jgi:hypothetical protein
VRQVAGGYRLPYCVFRECAGELGKPQQIGDPQRCVGVDVIWQLRQRHRFMRVLTLEPPVHGGEVDQWHDAGIDLSDAHVSIVRIHRERSTSIVSLSLTADAHKKGEPPKRPSCQPLARHRSADRARSSATPSSQPPSRHHREPTYAEAPGRVNELVSSSLSFGTTGLQ